ncbi:hypothetical protein R1flu_005009 [Riccia fluitans]|uniref:Uncharacterized protein n=1 Tax=Riccia fluitans TaxID=41844 RepID=A0ABD1YRY1_9MARC
MSLGMMVTRLAWIAHKLVSSNKPTRATVPGLKRWGFLTPPVAGADLRAAFVASCFLGAFPPVDLRAVCFVRAICVNSWNRGKMNTDECSGERVRIDGADFVVENGERHRNDISPVNLKSTFWEFQNRSRRERKRV